MRFLLEVVVIPKNYLVVVDGILSFLYLLLIARALLSWLPIRPRGLAADITDVIKTLTEPFLAPIRKIVPPLPMGATYLDLSPLLLILLVRLLRGILF